MNLNDLTRLSETYRTGLLEDTLSFWTGRCVDHEHGGFTFCLDRQGNLYDTDKGMWQQGRFTWMLGTLYCQVQRRPEWLDLAKHGVEFIRKHGFDEDGRMFFIVTKEGDPLRKRRYVFTETFTTTAFAAYARAANDERAGEQALELFRLVVRYLTTPGLLPPRHMPRTRDYRGLATPIVVLGTAQELQKISDDPILDEWIERSIDDIEKYHLHDEFEAVLETVSPQGAFIDHHEGRTLNPGHAIEAGWFVLREALRRGRDPHLIRLGTTIVDWAWRWGWDEQYGGMIYFRDVLNKPFTEYWHDMKFWWPQNETIIANLLAYYLTDDPKYAQRHRLIHEWTYQHFPDREFGEWFGYLHRDGRVSTDVKGNLWKGPFHLPRMQLYAWRLCEAILEKRKSGRETPASEIF